MEDGKKEEKADAEDETDEETAWYELPPGAFFFTAGVLAAFLPKDALFAGEYTDPTAILLIVSNLVIFTFFAAFVVVVRHIGLTSGVQWMVSPGFGVEEIDG
jgi:hypothetical protein